MNSSCRGPGRSLSWLSCLLALPLAAQDMLGVTFAGDVLRLDANTGQTTLLASGQPGKDSLVCATDNRIWTTIRSGSAATGFAHHLARIDPVTGAETLPFGTTDYGDIRAMAAGLLGRLMAIRDTGTADELIRIDPVTGGVTVLGATGFTQVEALDITSAGLRAWDQTAGLLILSLATGAATDPFPAVGSPPGITWMATDPTTFATLVGNGSTFALDVFTGVTTPLLTFAGNPDLRGAEFTTARQQVIGTACAAANGTPALFVSGPFASPGTVTIVSTRHAVGVFGMQIVGFREDEHAGLTLPFDLDPLLGTVGCRLRVSIDGTIGGVTNSSGQLVVAMALPAGLQFFQFYAQHAVFEPVPGNLSFTAGLRVRPGL